MSAAARRPTPAGLAPGHVFLRPGQYFVGDERHQVRTVLGSCVSITLWNARQRIGAMSHFLLSHSSTWHACLLDARYAEGALLLMLRELAHLGVDPAECGAKIFGGGNMFPQQPRGSGAIEVGRRNGEAARSLLLQAGIPILSESLFGDGHRQIIFDIARGDVWARQLRPVNLAVAGTSEVHA